MDEHHGADPRHDADLSADHPSTLGIDPITFGIIFTLNCEIGFVTPPLGTSLFVAMPIANVKLGEISYASIPFIMTVFVVIGIIIAYPGIPLWLPNLLMGPGH